MRATQEPAVHGRAQRILVHGVTGSGRTVLAERIARRTGLEEAAS